MAATYMTAFDIERVYHSTENGFRHAATFQITLDGNAYSKILVNVLWNAKTSLLKNTTSTETVVTSAGLSIAKSGVGWVEVSDIPGEDAWIDFSKRVIRFSKRFAMQVPVSPAASVIPKIGDALEKIGATISCRVEVEGYLDVVSYQGDIKVTIY
jgi:hypothetical protein